MVTDAEHTTWSGAGYVQFQFKIVWKNHVYINTFIFSMVSVWYSSLVKEYYTCNFLSHTWLTPLKPSCKDAAYTLCCCSFTAAALHHWGPAVELQQHKVYVALSQEFACIQLVNACKLILGNAWLNLLCIYTTGNTANRAQIDWIHL